MRAEIKTSFSRGFFLGEDSVKKIEDIMRRRMANENNYKQEFTVRRVDHAKITYDNSNDLFANEENSKVDAVEKLELKCVNDESSASIVFEKNEKTLLEIESTDRDMSLLLTADLKDYIKGEVSIRRLAVISRILNDRNFPMIIFAIPMLFLFIISPFRDRSFSINAHRSTMDQKLNFLVEIAQSKGSLEGNSTYLLGFILAFVFMMYVIASPAVMPTHTFYWGKEVSRYDSAKSVREKTFWGVAVALIVGVVATIFSKQIGF